MTIIFEGTFAELQNRMSALPLPLGVHVRLVSDEQAVAQTQSPITPIDASSTEDTTALYFDRIKEMAEDDDDYFLRFYRSSRH